jgi:hypothetical protein
MMREGQTPPWWRRHKMLVGALLTGGWGLLVGGLFGVAVWLSHGAPPQAPAPAPVAAPVVAHDPEALFWHYARDLRWALRGDIDRASRLVEDVGRDRVVFAHQHFHAGRYAEGVAVLDPVLHLRPAERQAWLRLLPALQAYEFSPTWQKAGVRR